MTFDDYMAIWCVAAPLVTLAIIVVVIVWKNVENKKKEGGE